MHLMCRFLERNNLYKNVVTFWPNWNEPKSRKFVRRAPSAGCRAKLSKQAAPRQSEKKFSRTNRNYIRWVSISHRFPQRAKNFTDVGRRYEFERGKIKYTKAVNVFGLVTKSWQSKLTMKRYEKHSKRQGARANHPKQPALPERRAPKADYPTRAPTSRLPHSSAGRRAPIFSEQADFWGFHSN